MSRPRIDGINEMIIQDFVERGYYRNASDVITAALKLLVREQRRSESEQINQELLNDPEIYQAQLDAASIPSTQPLQRVARPSKRVARSY